MAESKVPEVKQFVAEMQTAMEAARDQMRRLQPPDELEHGIATLRELRDAIDGMIQFAETLLTLLR